MIATDTGTEETRTNPSVVREPSEALCAQPLKRLPLPPLSPTEQNFVGIWELVDSYDFGPNDEIVRSRGEMPRGRLVYHADRQMEVQVTNDGRPQFSSLDPAEWSPEEVKAAFSGYTSYFGFFEVNEKGGYVRHLIESSLIPNEVGRARERFFEFCGNRLTLTTSPFAVEGGSRVRRIIWERMGLNS
jgi:hypothetical protein